MLSILKVFNTFVKTFVQKDAAISHHNAKLSVHISAFIQGEPFVHKSTFNKQSTLLPTHNKNLDQHKSIKYHYRATSDPAYQISMKNESCNGFSTAGHTAIPQVKSQLKPKTTAKNVQQLQLH